MRITIHNLDIFPAGVAIQWNDGKESFIDYRNFRDECPCASCQGETDVFGNVYGKSNAKKTDASYQLQSLEQVGHYALAPRWTDGHSDGIFSYELLRSIDLK